MPNDEIIPHREETCPHREKILLTQHAVNQILQTLEKIEKRLCEHAESFERKFDTIIETMDKKFVTKDQFQPVKIIVYGMAGLIMTSFLLAVANLLLHK